MLLNPPDGPTSSSEGIADLDLAAFNAMMGTTASATADDIALELSADLQRLRAGRTGEPSWFDYHRTLLDDGRHLDVAIVDRHDPNNPDSWLARVITRENKPHRRGDIVVVSDDFWDPANNGYLHETGEMLAISPTDDFGRPIDGPRKLPLGLKGRPVLKVVGCEVNLVSGSQYDHYPDIPQNDAGNRSANDAMARLGTVLAQLDDSTRQIGYVPGTGEF